ncbi:MAG: cyclic nucleotide-binding domain-containing protein [Deltaproteobacteria bacterium]|nr:cyclic nucleotide-binding domain-containing protein [Deltaproteobacteria bacterium]
MVDPKVLREMHFFSDLTDDELEAISRIIQEKDYKMGETIFSENEAGQSLYIIKKGEVKACKVAPDGELLTLTLLKDGDVFGEMSFLDGRYRSATIVAIADTETFVIDKEDFEGLIDGHPWMVYKLMKNIVYTIHSLLRGMNARYMEMINYMWGRRR